MIYVAHISQGLVVNVTIESEDFIPYENSIIVGQENTVGVGFSYDGATFQPPVVESDGMET